MPKVTFIERDGTVREFDAPVGLSLLEIAHKHDIDLEGACDARTDPGFNRTARS